MWRFGNIPPYEINDAAAHNNALTQFMVPEQDPRITVEIDQNSELHSDTNISDNPHVLYSETDAASAMPVSTIIAEIVNLETRMCALLQAQMTQFEQSGKDEFKSQLKDAYEGHNIQIALEESMPASAPAGEWVAVNELLTPRPNIMTPRTALDDLHDVIYPPTSEEHPGDRRMSCNH